MSKSSEPQELFTMAEEVAKCVRCKLHETRNKPVFGEGRPNANLMFVAEAPGAEEDREGVPFVGRAGKLLDKLILESGWDRKDVYIANIVKCRPPENRDPEAGEINACKDFLFRQLKVVKPKVIITLGKPAAHLLLNTKEPLYKLRGRIEQLSGAKVIPTYHPSYILRGNHKNLPKIREDFGEALKILANQGIYPPRRMASWACDAILSQLF
jgi:uracil-DNA glycosylase